LQARWRIGYSSDKLDLSAAVNYKSKLKESQTSLIGITEEKTFTTVDLSAQYRFSPDLSVNLGVTNLFNTLAPAQANSIYTSNGLAYPVTGRIFNIGAHVSF
jgi:outer membrane receptor protein involved in Fe transport